MHWRPHPLSSVDCFIIKPLYSGSNHFRSHKIKVIGWKRKLHYVSYCSYPYVLHTESEYCAVISGAWRGRSRTVRVTSAKVYLINHTAMFDTTWPLHTTWITFWIHHGNRYSIPPPPPPPPPLHHHHHHHPPTHPTGHIWGACVSI